jgi:creatinine amidohydrolase
MHISAALFSRLAETVGGVILPPLIVGPDRVRDDGLIGMDFCTNDDSSRYADGQLPGSAYWVPDDLFAALLLQVLKNLKRAGFRIVVAHGHGPSTGCLARNQAAWEAETGLTLFHAWGEGDPALGIMTDHAAHNETSLMLAAYPELVALENLPETEWPRGVGGRHPREATAKAGEAACRFQTERLATLLRQELAKSQ